MAFIRTIPPLRATGETAEVYRYAADMTGYPRTPNIVKVFSLRAGSMKRMVRVWELALWVGDEPRTMRELVAAAVSRLNDCHY